MKTSTKVVFCMMVLIWSISAASLCPEKGVVYETFSQVSQTSINNEISSNGKTFYEIINEEGIFKLKAFKVAEQQLTVKLQLQNFETLVHIDSKIVATSENGNCVVVLGQKDGSVKAFETSTGEFVSVQQFTDETFSAYVMYHVSDDCTLIGRMETLPEEELLVQWFKDSVETTQVTFPLTSMGDSNFHYVVDDQRNLYSLHNGVYVKTFYQELKSEPIHVKWSELLQAVITVTKHLESYSIVVIDPKADQILYKKTFVLGTNYTQSLHFEINPEEVSILIGDASGFVSFIQLQRQDNTATETVYELKDSTVSETFKAPALFSVSNQIIFVYSNKKMSYFEASNGFINLLSGFDTDIELEAYKHRAETLDTHHPKVVLTLIAPEELGLCTIPESEQALPPTISSSTESAPPTVVDPVSGAAVKCPNNCLDCSSAQVCTSCKTGFSLDKATGECKPCKGCLTCSETDVAVCYTCFPPQILNKETNECVSPVCQVQNCYLCNGDGTCKDCLYGYGLFNGECVKCQPESCKRCPTDVAVCQVCKSGHVLYTDPKTSQTICQPCGVGIKICALEDLTAAIECASGHYLVKDSQGINRCSKCSNNCQECKDGKSCAKCVSGFVPSQDGTKCVVRCSDNCLTCDETNPEKCLTCYAGGQLDTETNKCIAALGCTEQKSCTFCNDGFVLKEGECLECTYEDENCNGCQASDLSVCTSCSVGFYLSPENTCVACAEGCKDCVGAQSCVRCKDGFFLTPYDSKGIGSCSACDATCVTCSSSPVMCSSCPEGFDLIGSKCISKKNVQVDLVIQANVNQFGQFMRQFVGWFVKTANEGKQPGSKDIDQKSVAIKSIKPKGSSAVTATISSGTNSNAGSMTNTFNAAMSQNPTIGGYQIISGSASVQTDQPDPVIPEEKSNLGLILGLSIPLGLLALVAIVIIAVKLGQRKQEGDENYKYDDKNSVDHLGASNGRI